MAQPNISGYTIVDRIGSGGFASVYLATDDITTRQTAIKVLHDHTSQPDDLRRFERERMSLRALSGHPNIVAVYDSGETEEGQHYTVLEYIDGGSVRDRITEGGALHWATAVEIGVQICSALDVAHRSGVLHRDVKPANILLDDNTSKLSDFGIARLIGQSQVTAAQSIIGTLAYTPPEVFHNKPFDGRGDIYQLGVSLYEMLLGRAPFTSAAADNKATIIRRILDHPAPPLAQFDIPQPLSDLLDEVLAKDPADRPQTAESFGRRLNDVERELGRQPTEVGVDTAAIVADTSTILLDTGETHPLTDFDADDEFAEPEPTNPASVSVGADPTVLAVPIAPEVPSPLNADVTVAEPRPESATSILTPEPASLPEPEQFFVAPPEAARTSVPIGDSASHEPPLVDSAPNPKPERRRPRRWPWILALLLLAGAVGGSVYAWQIADRTATEDPTGVDTDEVDPPVEDPSFVALDDPAFADPDGTTGVIFASVANTQGLTMVGGAGTGESVSRQRSVVWTIGPGAEGERTILMRSDFASAEGLSASNQRLFDIGVIDGKQLLAVGEAQGGGGTNGVAWIGDRAGLLRPENHTSFQTGAAESLRGAAGDADNNQFIVVGSRQSGSNLVMGLWTLSGDSEWETPPVWDPIDIGTGNDGVLNDVAVEGELAVAVGSEMIDGTDAGVVLIRRGTAWAELITAIPDSTFHAVVIAGERIIAVGERNTDGDATPFAVVTTPTGEGFVHNLPIRGDTGIARAVAVVADGRVVAVGDVDGDPDRDGAIWELLPGEELIDDKWTTRATPDLQVDGFTELWAIDEFDDIVYIFGRTEADGAEPAGAWTLTLE